MTPSVSQTLETISAFWRSERTGPLLSLLVEPTYRQMLDHQAPDLEAVADSAVECIRADVASGAENVVPTVYADFGTISTAKLFGGAVIPPPEGGKLHIEPVVQTPDELESLEACPFEESDFQTAIELWRLVCDRLGTDEVFLRTPDFQGPLNTLALVMNQQELLMGMYSDPEAIQAALESITTTLIDYHQRLRAELGGGRVVGSIWPYTVLPENLGASLTQDMMPLISAELYRDFELPQVRRIAEAFNGVQIHCCGKYAHQLPALRDSGVAVRALEFHHPFTQFADIHAVFGDDIVYIPYLFGECDDYTDYVEFAADLIGQGTPDTRFYFALAHGWADEQKLRACLPQS